MRFVSRLIGNIIMILPLTYRQENLGELAELRTILATEWEKLHK